MLDMARHYREGAIRARAISRRQGIPLKYLEQILVTLKKAGLVSTVRGSKGGYSLTRKPDEISVGEIVEVLEGGRVLSACWSRPEACDRSVTCVTRFLWQEVADAMYEKLDSFRLSDLVRMLREADANTSGDSLCEDNETREEGEKP